MAGLSSALSSATGHPRRRVLAAASAVALLGYLLVAVGVPGAQASLAPGAGAGPDYCAQYGSVNSPYSYDDVYACNTSQSSGPTPFNDYGPNGTQSFQCNELAGRFIWAVYGLTSPVVSGAQFVAAFHSAHPDVAVISPGPGQVPAPGDVISVGPGGYTDPVNGHVAVVVTSNPGTGQFTVMSQNDPAGSAGEQTMQVDLSGGHNGTVNLFGDWTAASWLDFASYTSSSPPSAGAQCNRSLPAGTVVGMAVTSDGRGYWIASSSGPVAACGDAPSLGDGPAGVAAIASAPSGDGYWLTTASGSVYAFGTASYHGGVAPGTKLAAAIVAMAADPATGGYWLLGGDGGVFSYDAPFYGSTGSIHLARPAVGMEATLDGHGYRFVASDGGVFDYGNAKFYGSTGGIRLNKPVVGMADDPATGGYWLDASDGGIFSFNAPFYGSTGGVQLARPCVGMTAMPQGSGYRFVAADGGVFDFGTAPFEGSAVG